MKSSNNMGEFQLGREEEGSRGRNYNTKDV